MKNSYFLVNILATVLILSATSGVALCLIAPDNPQTISASEKQAEPQIKTKFLLGDEKSGIPNRELDLDADGIKRELRAKFPDGAQVVVTFDSLSRVLKTVETHADGSYQVITFKPSKHQLSSAQTFRKDKTLSHEIKLSGKKSVQQIHYADNGETPICLQQQDADGTFLVIVYHDDGKTPKAEYRNDSEGVSELKLYKANGTLLQEQKATPVAITKPSPATPVTRDNKCLSVIGYRDDGKTVWFKHEGLGYFPSTADGRDLLASINSLWKIAKVFFGLESPAKAWWGNPENERLFSINVYGGSDAPVQRLYLRNDLSLEKCEEIGSDGEVSASKTYRRGEALDGELATLVQQCLHAQRDSGCVRPFLRMKLNFNPSNLQKALADL